MPVLHLRVDTGLFKSIYPLTASPKERVRGEILHLSLSFIRDVDDISNIEDFVRRALSMMGEREDNWNVEKQFLKPLKRFFSVDDVKQFFQPEAVEVLTERNLIVPDGGSIRVLRPDRIVVFRDRVVVVDFKSTRPFSKDVAERYRSQVAEYVNVCRSVFSLPSEGYLAFIEPPCVEPVEVK